VVRVFSTLCVLVPVLVLCVASQYPGVTLDYSNYLDSADPSIYNGSMEPGFSAAFPISMRHARIITVCSTLIGAYCFMWASCRQIQALADAQLLFPGLLKQREGESESPTRALIATVLFGLCCMIFIAIASAVIGLSPATIIRTLLNIQTITKMLMYCCVLLAYVYFRTWGHGAAAEKYKSPFGRAGAVCAALIFSFVIASVPFRGNPMISTRQTNISSGLAFSYVAVYLILLSVYYYRVAEAAQTTTDAESEAYLSIYAVRGMKTDRYYCCKH
jgi:amino acid permease